MYRFWALANVSRGKQLKGFVFSREHSSLGFVHPASSWEATRRAGKGLQAGLEGNGDPGPGPSSARSSLCDPGTKTRTVMAGHLPVAISPPNPRSPLSNHQNAVLGCAKAPPDLSLNHLFNVITTCTKAPPNLSPNHQLGVQSLPQLNIPHPKLVTSPNLGLQGAPHLRERCQASHVAITAHKSFQSPFHPPYLSDTALRFFTSFRRSSSFHESQSISFSSSPVPPLYFTQLSCLTTGPSLHPHGPSDAPRALE